MANKINILDDNTINKIAAGEVIERPSSIVKELIENSIDANSKNITIEIKEGGKNYIRITDDGDGIYKDDIQLAFLRHSTSKINNSDDLMTIHSLGFRGEALASIASVSMVELITKTNDTNIGNMIEIHGGVLKEEAEVGAPDGTTVIIRNIFYNTPVRRKFLKSISAETANISNIINKLSLSNPHISFNYIKDNKSVLKTPGNNDIKSTIFSIYGKEHIESLIDINFKNKDFSLTGYISKPNFTRGNRNNELIFINGRYVSSISLSQAIEDAYSSLITVNRYPITYLYINIDPKNIDVNVHPSKIEVRFNNDLEIIAIIKNIIREKLLEKNLIPKINFNKKKNEEKQENIIDIIDDNTKENININNTLYKGKKEKNIDLVNENLNNDSDKFNNNYTKEKKDYNKEKHEEKQEQKVSKIFPDLNIVGRIFNTYIIGEDKINNSMYMIDQHAAHERVMYEKFRTQFQKEEVVVQPLLVARTINLNHYDYELVKESMDLFTSLGFDISDFGHNSILLRGVPMLFGLPNDNDLFIDILDNLNNDLSNKYELRVEKIIKMACTNAIKAGDFLGDIEINNLISDLKKCNNPFTCPHGRPITIKITRYEIEKMFKRIQ